MKLKYGLKMKKCYVCNEKHKRRDRFAALDVRTITKEILQRGVKNTIKKNFCKDR